MGNETPQIKEGFTYESKAAHNDNVLVRCLKSNRRSLRFWGVVVSSKNPSYPVGHDTDMWAAHNFELVESIPEYDLFEELPEDIKDEESMLNSMSSNLEEHMSEETKKLWEKFEKSLHRDLAKKFQKQEYLSK